MVSVTSLLKKCRDLCSYANRSTKFNTVMRNQQFIQMGLSEANCLNLPHSDTETRWNSSYYMVEKMIKLKLGHGSCFIAPENRGDGLQFPLR